jgi:hypothetical protein
VPPPPPEPCRPIPAQGPPPPSHHPPVALQGVGERARQWVCELHAAPLAAGRHQAVRARHRRHRAGVDPRAAWEDADGLQAGAEGGRRMGMGRTRQERGPGLAWPCRVSGSAAGRMLGARPPAAAPRAPSAQGPLQYAQHGLPLPGRAPARPPARPPARLPARRPPTTLPRRTPPARCAARERARPTCWRPTAAASCRPTPKRTCRCPPGTTRRRSPRSGAPSRGGCAGARSRQAAAAAAHDPRPRWRPETARRAAPRGWGRGPFTRPNGAPPRPQESPSPAQPPTPPCPPPAAHQHVVHLDGAVPCCRQQVAGLPLVQVQPQHLAARAAGVGRQLRRDRRREGREPGGAGEGGGGRGSAGA